METTERDTPSEQMAARVAVGILALGAVLNLFAVIKLDWGEGLYFACGVAALACVTLAAGFIRYFNL